MELTLLTILLKSGEYSAIFLLLFYLHSLRINKLKEKYSVGSCRGRPYKCHYYIARQQSLMIDARYEVLMGHIHKEYSLKMLNENISSSDLNICLGLHKALLEECFIPAIRETKRFVFENGIPTDPKRFDKYAVEKLDLIWEIVWSTYSEKYHKSFFIIPLKKVSVSESRFSYIEMMKDLILTAKDIANERRRYED